MSEPKHILSLGLGVQSSTLAFLADAGVVLPRPIYCGFGDTMAEPKAVYDWKVWLESKISIPIVTLSRGSLRDDSLQNFTSKKSGLRYMKTLIPAFTMSPEGKKGLLGRKCTADYKIALLIKEARRHVPKTEMLEWRRKHKPALKEITAYEKDVQKYKKARKQKLPFVIPVFPLASFKECQDDALVIMWIGISTDEADRKKPSKNPWIRNRWPLIELGMSREDCKAWMLSHGYPEPPRSACTFCPFHSDDEWIRIRDETPDEFEDVVKFERALQETARNQTALKGIPFLHDSCKPIDQIDFKPTNPGYKQVSLFGNECEGLCGV